MKICERAVGWVQTVDELGAIRGCGWSKCPRYGNILKQDIKEILNSPIAKEMRNSIMTQKYDYCSADNCPYLMHNTMDEHSIEWDGKDIEYPHTLYIGHDGVCNYRCTCCTSYQHMEHNLPINYQENNDAIEKKLIEILPHIKTISAHGRGELFTSTRTLKLLANWKPLAPVEECSVELETNGSLFDREHWNLISNLGKYHVTVFITIMSFDEGTYQFLSGCKYPISKIESNLLYVKSLREQGIINELEIASVVQEYNFREMPEFTRRCIEEFGADSVRLRQIRRGGGFEPEIQWFMDVRNPHHPYYREYKRIFDQEIFKHPKVYLWSGENDTPNGESLIDKIKGTKL